MTSPAQKAAGEIAKLLTGRDDTPLGLPTSIIQQALTEAVDAAVAKERERCMKLAADWREKYPGDHFIVKGAVVETLATELESLVKEK